MAFYYIKDPKLGSIQVRLRIDSRNISARFVDGESWRITCPSYATDVDIRRFIDENIDKLLDLQKRSQLKRRHYKPGDFIQGFGFSATITADSPLPDKATIKRDGNHFFLNLPSAIDMAAPNVTHYTSQCLTKIANLYFMELVKYAKSVAAELGVNPRGFVQGRGVKKLGHCTRDHVIQLSIRLMFLPEHLIRFVICHELAHMTHLNHSDQFHALCDQYCGGAESQLDAELKHFTWPII